MALISIINGQLNDASQIMDLIQALQQPVGGSEVGYWFLAGNTSVSGGIVSMWVTLLNHFSTPSGITVNTTISTPTGGLNTLVTNNIESSGFQLFATATSGSGNARAGGSYVASF